MQYYIFTYSGVCPSDNILFSVLLTVLEQLDPDF